MAAPVLTLVNITPYASPDLTALTGGLSQVVGSTGADWLVSYNFPRDVYKSLGGQQILPVPFVDAGGELPHNGVTSTNYAVVYQNADTGDGTLTGSTSETRGNNWSTTSATQLNAGIQFTFPSDQTQRTFVWLGQLCGGTFTAEAVMADGSLTVSTITLPPETSNVYAYRQAWFQASWCSVASTTITLRIRKTAVQVNGITLQIVNQACYLQVPVQAPTGRGLKLVQAYHFGV